jgi:hypothetical protein
MLSFYEFFNILENQKRKNIAEAFDLSAAKARKAAQALADLQKKASGGSEIEPPTTPPEYNTPAPANTRSETPSAPARRELRGVENLSRLDARMPITGLKVDRPEQSKNQKVALPSEKGFKTEFQNESGKISLLNGQLLNESYREALSLFIQKNHLQKYIRLAIKSSTKKSAEGKEIPNFILKPYKYMPEKPYVWAVDGFEQENFPTSDLYGNRDILLIESDVLNDLFDKIQDYFKTRVKQNIIGHTESLDKSLLQAADETDNVDDKNVLYLAYYMLQYMFSNKLRNIFPDNHPFVKKDVLADKLKNVTIENLAKKSSVLSLNDVDENAALETLINYSKRLNYELFFEDEQGLIGINYDFSDSAKISSADWSIPKMKKENADYIDVMDLMEYWGN